MDAPASTLRAIDLFAGAGGLSAGFEWAGGKVIAGVEIDEGAAATFSANHSSVRDVFGDIRAMSGGQARRTVGPVDVVLGGPNCQGVSQRGKRDPYDERNFAFWAYCDYVRAFKPEVFLMENVPALVSDVHNRELAIAVFEELGDLGYQLSAEVVCAAWLGVPQLRYRLVVMGALSFRPVFPAAVARGVQGELAEADFVTVGQAIMDLPALQAGGGRDVRPLPTSKTPLSDYERMMREGAERLHNHWSAKTDPINLRRIEHVSEGGNWHDIPLELLPDRFRHVRLSDHTTTYRRLHRQHPAHVVTCLCGNVTAGAFTHPLQDRAISVREAARLQGFPDRFHFLGPRSSQYRQVGNAVPALMARRLTEALVAPIGSGQQPDGWTGRIDLEVLRAHADRRLPFTLAPRYKALFAKGIDRRRRDLQPA